LGLWYKKQNIRKNILFLISAWGIFFNFTFLYTVMIRLEDGGFDSDALEPINAEPFGLSEGLLLVWLMEIFGSGI
jgi:hypothetical protein